MREGQRNLGFRTASPVLPALVLGGVQSLEKQLKVRFLARLKPKSLLRKEDQDRRGARVGATLLCREAPGPAGKPAYLERWHRLKIGP